MVTKTSDICDFHQDRVRLVQPLFRAFGAVAGFSGPVKTVRVFEDNDIVHRLLAGDGQGQVLVIDGGGSLRCALMGDRMARRAIDRGWAGAIINGCIRDSAEIDTMPFGVRALGTCPFRPGKLGAGEIDVPLSFAGVVFVPGEYVYVDVDGILLSEVPLVVTGGAEVPEYGDVR